MPEQATILVVDDEIGPRESLRAILKSEYRVLVATEGEQAVKMVEESPIDVVLLDLRMPGVSGVHVMERIKAMDPDIEVILITGYASYETVLEALRLHAFDYIPKPFNIAQLRDLVRRAVARRASYVQKPAQEQASAASGSAQVPSGSSVPVEVAAMQNELERIRAALLQHCHGTLQIIEKGSQELTTQYGLQLDAHGREVVQRIHAAAAHFTQNLTEILSQRATPSPTQSSIRLSTGSINA